ncbi:hypothetical protein [Arthrobacter castelli]|uniref:hypothetical protein n=1 Tax=Arthrobacter castelli TaxID=271431 RepID=UPI00056C7CF5|nr:hypothetical protein [Arthrobacter castelli]
MRRIVGAVSWGVIVVVLTTVGVAGCSSRQGMEGECTLKVRDEGAVYRAVAVASMPRPGRSLGSAHFGDCDGSPLQGSYQGELFALPNTSTDQAVLLGQGGHASVYVNTALKMDQWPALLKAASQPVTCEESVAFTGTWDIVIDDGAMPDEGDYDLTVPYTAAFTTAHGMGLDLDTWSRVELDARITSNTDPVPTPRFLKQALAAKNPPQVTVTATCRGTKFDVATIEFAD